MRVLTLGENPDDAKKPYSVELCGGTHVRRTGDIALFSIFSEGGVAAGIRRIEGGTGAAALAHLKAQAALAKIVASNLKTPLESLPERVSALSDERRKLERELSDAKRKLAMAGNGGAAAPVGPEDVGGVKLIARVLEGVPAKDLRGLVDDGKKTLGSGVIAFIGVEGGKAALAIGRDRRSQRQNFRGRSGESGRCGRRRSGRRRAARHGARRRTQRRRRSCGADRDPRESGERGGLKQKGEG